MSNHTERPILQRIVIEIRATSCEAREQLEYGVQLMWPGATVESRRDTDETYISQLAVQLPITPRKTWRQDISEHHRKHHPLARSEEDEDAEDR